MSDAPQGPGWWMASDGKWYPPESRPQPAPPPPPASVTAPPLTPPARPTLMPPAPPTVAPPPGTPTPYPGYPITPGVYGSAPAAGWLYAPSTARASSGLNGTIQGFLWAAAALSAIAAVLALFAMSGFDTYWGTPLRSRAEARAYDDWVALDDAFAGVGGLVVLCGLVVVILLMIWMNQAHKASQQWWHGPRQWSSGWTIGGWFIPIANALIPKMVLTEIEKIALAPRSNGQLDAGWRRRPAMVIGNLWWGLLVAGLVVMIVGDAIGGADESTAGQIRVGYVLNAIAYVALAASGVFGALYLRRLNRAFNPSV